MNAFAHMWGAPMTDPATYGIMAEFETAEELLAMRRAPSVAAGYTRVETYTPCPCMDWRKSLEFTGHRLRESCSQAASSAASAAIRCSIT